MRHTISRLAHDVLPRGLVNFVWNAASDLNDLPARLAPGRPPVPWRVVHNVGGGNFHELGTRYFAFFEAAVDLDPGDHVLDIGCGAGRLAFPIGAYLDETGRYTGFDISRRALDWAQRHVTSRAVMTFAHARVRSREYASRGEPARRYRFPAADRSIDHALAISVFSHLLPEDAAHYLTETGRVLRPGGRLFATAFLVDAAVSERLGTGVAGLPMVPFRDQAWAASPKEPERAIAYELAAFEDWIAAAGLRYAAPVVPGHWSRPDIEGEFQDRIVLERI